MAEPEVGPQRTPEGHVQELTNSSQTRSRLPNTGPSRAHSGADETSLPSPPQLLPALTGAVQQLVQLLARQEAVNEERNNRFANLECEVARLQGRNVLDPQSSGQSSLEERRPTQRRLFHR